MTKPVKRIRRDFKQIKAAQEALRFGDRLASELAALIALIPPEHLTASGMSRWLAVNRGTCQRVLLAVRAAGDRYESLRKAPGVEGVDEFVRAMATRVGRKPQIDRAEAMVQEYALLVQHAGGSQSKLVRLATHGGATDDAGAESAPGQEQMLEARRAIYRASCVTTGMWSAANITVQVFRPSSGVAGSLDEAHARGYIGVRRRVDGLALYSRLLGATDPAEMATIEGEKGEGRQWSKLLAEFCSTPLPTVISQVEGGSNAWIILGDGAVLSPVDVVLGGRSSGSHPDPRTDREFPHLSAMIGLRFPSRTQLYDLYLHRDLTAGGTVQANALARHPGDVDPAQNWYDKLAYKPRLKAMGRGLTNEIPQAYPRMRDLTEHLFSRVGWDAGEFELWRLELEYPTPGMFYTITLHTGAIAGD